MRPTISFHNEDSTYRLSHKKLIKKWITSSVESEKLQYYELNFIFTSDQYLHQLNIEYLNHDTYTDIITFQYNEEGNPIHGDIFISIDRVKDNALKFKQPLLKELHRMIIHGLLHLMGYQDKIKEAKELMTFKEDYYLSLRPKELL